MTIGDVMQTIKSGEDPMRRVMRLSSELRQYYLEKERQTFLEDTSFKDTLQAFIENRGNAGNKATLELEATVRNDVMPYTQGSHIGRSVLARHGSATALK